MDLATAYNTYIEHIKSTNKRKESYEVRMYVEPYLSGGILFFDTETILKYSDSQESLFNYNVSDTSIKEVFEILLHNIGIDENIEHGIQSSCHNDEKLFDMYEIAYNVFDCEFTETVFGFDIYFQVTINNKLIAYFEDLEDNILYSCECNSLQEAIEKVYEEYVWEEN